VLSAAVAIGSGDLATVVDSHSLSKNGTRDIQRGECTVIIDEAVSAALAVSVLSGDLATVVDGLSDGSLGTWGIQRGERTVLIDEALLPTAAFVESGDLATVVDGGRGGEDGARWFRDGLADLRARCGKDWRLP
jgi:hypothetical protein